MNEYEILRKENMKKFDKLDAILALLCRNFNDEFSIYFASTLDQVRMELMKCLNEILEVLNPYHYYHLDQTIAFDGEYQKMIDHVGYEEVLSQGKEILEADFVLLAYDGDHSCPILVLGDRFNCSSIACMIDIHIDYILGDKEDEELNKKINQIIENYWGNTFEFDYGEYDIA